MPLEFGKPVVTSDGVQLGTVDRLIVEPETRDFRELIVHRGLLSTKDRLVEEELIERIDDDGTVHLTVTADEAEQLPVFAEHAYITLSPEEVRYGPHIVAGGLGPTVLMRAGYVASGWEHVARGLGEPASLDTRRIEVQSNLPGEAVTISAGTDVVDVNGRRLGTVDELVYDADGEIQAIVVSAGLLFHHPVRVAIDRVETITHDTVRLSVTAEAAERESPPRPTAGPAPGASRPS